MRVTISILLIIYTSTFINAQNNGIKKEDSVFLIIESVPEFRDQHTPGGLLPYIRANFIYPEYAVRNNISGKVFVSFTVDAYKRFDQISNVYIIKGAHPSIDYAAMVMFKKLPDAWMPAKSRGKPDPPVTFVLPVKFDLVNVDNNNITSEYNKEIEHLLTLDSVALKAILYAP